MYPYTNRVVIERREGNVEHIECYQMTKADIFSERVNSDFLVGELLISFVVACYLTIIRLK